MGRNFRWLLASAWITNIGDGLALASGPLLIASQTHAPFLVALAVLLQRLPWLLFGLQAGALADRLNRRVLVVAVNSARALVLVALSVSLALARVNALNTSQWRTHDHEHRQQRNQHRGSPGDRRTDA